MIYPVPQSASLWGISASSQLSTLHVPAKSGKHLEASERGLESRSQCTHRWPARGVYGWSVQGLLEVTRHRRRINFKEKNMSAKIKSYSWSILVSTISKRLYDEWKNYIKLQETREPFILWGSKNPWFPLSLFPSPPQNGSAFFCTLESTTTFLFSRSTRVGTTRGSKPRHWKGETSRGSA